MRYFNKISWRRKIEKRVNCPVKPEVQCINNTHINNIGKT